jgi:O-antigen/teichoic acid export membrane protein
VSWLLPLVVTVVSTPIVIARLGLEAYGLYALALSYAGAVSSLNLGRGLVRELAATGPPGNVRHRAQLVGSALTVAAIVGVVGFIGLLLAAEPFARAVLGRQIDPSVARWALLLAAGAAPLTLLWQAAGAVPQGLSRFDIAGWIAAGGGVAIGLGNLALATRGHGVLALLGWNLAASAVIAMVAIALVWPLLGRGPGRPSADAMSALARFGGITVLCQIIGALWALAERTILARDLGTDAVALVAVPMAIGIYLQASITSATVLLVPMASRLATPTQSVSLAAVYARATRLVSLVVVGLSVTVAASSHAVLDVWLGAAFAASAGPVLQLLAIAYGLNGLATLAWHFTEGLNRPVRNATISLAWAIAGTVALLVLVPRLGLIGAGWARLVAMALVPVYIVTFERALLGGHPRGLWIRIAIRLAPAGALLWIWIAAGLRLFPHSLAGLAATCASGAMLYLGGAWLTNYFDGTERRWITDRLRTVLGRAPAKNRPDASDAS